MVTEPEKAREAPWWRERTGAWWAVSLALLLCAIAILPAAWHPIHFSASVIQSFPYQLDREEGFLLNQALQFKSGESIYQPLDDYPYTVGNYTPLFPLVYAAVLHFTKTGLAPGRLLALLSALGTVLLLGWYIWREGGEVAPAILAPLFFLATWDYAEWAPYARADLPAIFLGMAGFFLIGWGRAKWWLPAAAILFAAAFFTKQMQVFAPTAAVVWLFASGKRREALWLAAITGGIIVGLTLIFTIATSGEYWKHTVTYNRNEFIWSDLRIWTRHLWTFNRWWLLALLLCAALILLDVLRKQGRLGVYRGKGDRFGAAPLYLLFTVLSLPGIAKVGSAPNYLLEFHAVAVVVTGVCAGRLLGAMERPGKLAWIAGTVFLLLLAAHSWHTARLHQHPGMFPPPPDEYAQNAGAHILLRVQSAEGRVFAEEPIFLIMTRREVPYEPFIMGRLSIERGIVAERFLEDLRNGEFSLILATQNVEEDKSVVGLTPEIQEIMRTHFVLEETIPFYRRRTYYLYGWQGPSPENTAP